MNLFSLAQAFPTEEAAWAYWLKARWPEGVKCLACGHGVCYQITSKGKTGKVARKFECAECGLHFSATVGTLFHDSHLPLQKWFAAIAIMVESKKGVSAAQMARHIGVTYKTAWYLCHRIRQAMQEGAGFMVGGATSVVEIDEMFVGGRARLTGRLASQGKAAVIGLAERDGQIHMERLKDGVKLLPVREAVKRVLDPETPKVITDGRSLYRGVIPRAKYVETNHKQELKTRTWTSTYTVESAFSLFKRGIVGNYHKLSEEHLDRYLGEFCWRYNRRRQQTLMFDMVLGGLATNKPLPYKTLTYDPF